VEGQLKRQRVEADEAILVQPKASAVKDLQVDGQAKVENDKSMVINIGLGPAAAGSKQKAASSSSPSSSYSSSSRSRKSSQSSDDDQFGSQNNSASDSKSKSSI